MALRGIRGATSVTLNTKEEVISATRELLTALVKANGLSVDEIASVLFSTTRDLNAEFPAVAARELGWNGTPLLCMQEIDVPGSLSNCIRILIHYNTEKTQNEMKHVYLREAVHLRR